MLTPKHWDTGLHCSWMEYQPLPPHVGLVTPQMSWLSISLSHIHSQASTETRLFRVRMLMMNQTLMRVSDLSFPPSASSAQKIMEVMRIRRHPVDPIVSPGSSRVLLGSGRGHSLMLTIDRPQDKTVRPPLDGILVADWYGHGMAIVAAPAIRFRLLT